MCKVCSICIKATKLMALAVSVLFAVYFWNLDQKVLGWVYRQVNTMFDRKPVNVKF